MLTERDRLESKGSGGSREQRELNDVKKLSM